MELLTRSRCLAVVACCLTAVTITSCLVRPPERPSPFSHAVHAGVRDLDCSFCHGTASRPRLPGPQLCKPCHVQLGLAEASLDELFDESGRWVHGHVAQLAEGVVFDHAKHTAVACIECHGEIEKSDAIPKPAVGKDDCMGCHERTTAPDGCEVCHPGIGRDWQPPSHDTSWSIHHGSIVRAGTDAAADRCDLCHDEEQSCQQCHQETLPRDHTNYFRLRGHGVAVRIDRARCTACHRPDFCQVCHESTPPRSHTGSFGSPGNRHCMTCHFPLRENSCATCHKAAPSHRTAAPLPPGHDPAMNCRLCHGAGVRLPHFDNGTSCTACHR